jgi:acyl carrier protein
MDSLTSVELRNRLEKDLRCSLPTTLAFEYGSVGALAEYLLTCVPGWSVAIETSAAPGAVSAAASPSSPQIPIDSLSAAELADMLAREIEDEGRDG